ncbi:hypothetical protein [Burkholderia plantarii]|uniref:hypothetical protein n=1 Tax=Burkholderia plantarii TaxID=41899 RepID=UPI0007065144|nr:hypothetical protein [Burkholderia plantarii]ALK28951.1 hypothetical protein bpln_1g01200 [Burkholderia plantarii]GLZ17606.1 hypothetical protein Bpla01_11360 [Burkholderia plantarii]
MLERWLSRLAPKARAGEPGAGRARLLGGLAARAFARRGQCRLALAPGALTVRRAGASRKVPALFVERPLPAGVEAQPEALAALIAAALDESGGRGLPVQATFADALVRYFIVTPADNSVRLQDLRAAAGARLQALYGDDPAGWQIVADWQAAEPFLACAVSRRWTDALQQAVAAGRGCLVSAQPEFVAAWNRSRRELDARTWLATRGEHALTLGLIAAGPRARVAAVRTLALPDPAPSLGWLRAQVARAALLDDLPAPTALLLHGPRCEAWLPGATDFTDPGMSVRWAAPGEAGGELLARAATPAVPLGWSGSAR